MNAAGSRATVLSIVFHSSLALVLLLAGIAGDAPAPSRQAIIYAELLPLNDGGARSETDESATAAAEHVDPQQELPPPQPEATVARSDQVAPPIETAADPEPSAPTSVEPTEGASETALLEVAAPAETLALVAEESRFDPVAPPVAKPIPMPDPQRSMLSTKLASWTGRFTPEQSDPTMAWKHEGQQYTAVLRQLPADDTMGMAHVLVEVSTQENGNRISTEMRMKRLAFSNFAQFIDRWDPAVQIHDDEVDGRFHSNSEIHLLYNRDAKPVFHGRVTTASRGIRTDATGRVDREQMFLGGLETGVRSILLPKHFAASGGITVDDDRVQRFEDDTRITFYADGTYGWSHVDSAEAEHKSTISDGAHYIVAAQGKALYLKGVVKGKVLVYSPERIIIEDDLTYAHYPNIAADAGDYLGLVSDKSVEIAGPDVTGPGDLLITASIYAKRQFVVRNYRATASGTLVIYGSLTAGSVSATEPRFATRIEFDERLENMRPPSFPMTDRYELEAWDGVWKTEPIAK